MKILIVDDAKETRESLHNIIKMKINSNYKIMEAENGLDALGIVDSFQPDIVLTDVLMPKMDGIRFTSILKSQSETKHIFIAAITGLSGEEQIEKIYASGVDFYIAKPFQLDDIVARLKVITSLITQKRNIPNTTPAVVYNCFQDEYIKHYFTTFTITQENDLFLIFDYFSKQSIKYNSILLKDFMVMLVKTYRKMDTEKKEFDLIIEESESYIYITANDKSFVSTIEDLVDKHSNLLKYKRNTQAVSFRISVVKFMQLKDENTNTQIYQNELISAYDLMIVSSDDLEIYVEELKEALSDYKSLCVDDDTYNSSLHMILTTLFNQYTSIFKKVPEFDRISIALQSVTSLIDLSKNKLFSPNENELLIKNIDSLNAIVSLWVEKVIVTQESRDVHEYDYQIMNICSELEKSFN